jgi:predicted membrane-bound mannosyltransferase
MPDPVTALVATAAVIKAGGDLVAAIAAAATQLAAAVAIIAAAVVGVAATIAKYIPPPEDGKPTTFYKWVNKIGQNSKYAANKITKDGK